MKTDIKFSTKRVYKYKWDIFCLWMISFPYKKNPEDVVSVILEFFEMRGLNSNSEVASYISAIGYFLRKEGISLDVRHPKIKALKFKSKKKP